MKSFIIMANQIYSLIVPTQQPSFGANLLFNFYYTFLKILKLIPCNSYVWIAKIVANEMKKYNNGSITLLGSIYGTKIKIYLLQKYMKIGIDENYMLI